MATPNQPYPAYPPKPPASETNVWGLVGLILGLFGFFTIITAPIGLVMSMMGMKHPQNGIAIAGLIVSIFSTLWALVWAGVMVFYFGIIALMCGGMCFGMNAVANEAAVQAEARKVVAEELELQSWEVEIKGFSTGAPFSSGDKSFSGTAVYTDETGQKMAVDFSGDAEKVDGQWEVPSVQIDSEPYEWTDPYDDFENYQDDLTIEPADEMEDGAKDGESGGAADADEAKPGNDDAFDAAPENEPSPDDDPFAQPQG